MAITRLLGVFSGDLGVSSLTLVAEVEAAGAAILTVFFGVAAFFLLTATGDSGSDSTATAAGAAAEEEGLALRPAGDDAGVEAGTAGSCRSL